jgi:predicted nucleic acid-binding protein
VALIVADASVVVDLLVGEETAPRRAARERIVCGDVVFAPAHLDVEVMSALRGLARRAEVLAGDVPFLIEQLFRLPIRREPLTAPAALRVWQLRGNMTVYDAGYVALAEHLGAILLTCDGKFAGTPGVRCAVELFT